MYIFKQNEVPDIQEIHIGLKNKCEYFLRMHLLIV